MFPLCSAHIYAYPSRLFNADGAAYVALLRCRKSNLATHSIFSARNYYYYFLKLKRFALSASRTF